MTNDNSATIFDDACLDTLDTHAIDAAVETACEGLTCSESRRESLRIASANGANADVLRTLAEAADLRRGPLASSAAMGRRKRSDNWTHVSVGSETWSVALKADIVTQAREWLDRRFGLPHADNATDNMVVDLCDEVERLRAALMKTKRQAPSLAELRRLARRVAGDVAVAEGQAVETGRWYCVVEGGSGPISVTCWHPSRIMARKMLMAALDEVVGREG